MIPLPLSLQTHQCVALADLALRFGRVERITYHQDGLTPETDTTHTVMLSLVACQLAQASNNLRATRQADWELLDLGLISQFSTIHDIVEAECGDTPTLCVSPEDLAKKAAKEATAKATLLQRHGRTSWLGRTLVDYDEQKVREARFVRYVDKVLPKLTHGLNRGAGLVRQGVGPEKFLTEHARPQGERLMEQYPEFPFLREVFDAAAEWAYAAYAERQREIERDVHDENGEGGAARMSREEFLAGVQCDAVTDDDGFAYLAGDDFIDTNRPVYPSQVVHQPALYMPEWVTRVYWLNR